MSAHTCDALVVVCMDFRFQEYIRNWTDKNLQGKTFDLVGYAGATKELETVYQQIKLSIDLHQTKQIVLMHHEDCGAYGAAGTYERHVQDLHKAQAKIKTEYPDVQVDLYYIHLDGEFEKIS
ncbi:MAG: hypothetical protein GF390_00625 [Candidatus Pacebacteria bacterium]|nr:hypothetical protein [Candidatus Paceibacterota bacterium]